MSHIETRGPGQRQSGCRTLVLGTGLRRRRRPSRGIKQPKSLMSARVKIGGRLRRAVTSSSFSGASHEGLQAKDLVARMLLTINAAKPKSQYQAFSSTWACRQFHVAISRSLCRLSRLPSYAHTGRLAESLPGQPSSSGSNCHMARLPATTRSVTAGIDPVRVPGRCVHWAHYRQWAREQATHCSGFCRPRRQGGSGRCRSACRVACRPQVARRH